MNGVSDNFWIINRGGGKGGNIIDGESDGDNGDAFIQVLHGSNDVLVAVINAWWLARYNNYK